MKNKLDNHLSAYNGKNLYDFDNEILLKWYPKRVLLNTNSTISLLELGLGHGFTTSIFSNIFSRHVVLDGSPAVIKNFKKNFPDCNAEIVETYFEEFTTDEKFDVIVMGFVLEHVDDPIQIMKYYKSYLKPGGQIFISVPNSEVLNRRLGYLAGLLSDMQELSKHDYLLGHKRYYTVKTLERDVVQAGYTIKRMEGLYLKPLTTSQMLSLNLGDELIDAFCLAAIDYPELSCAMLAELTLLED